MIKTLKQFGALCAIESVVAVTFVVTSAVCASVEAIDGVVVSLLIAGAAIGLGISRFRALTKADAPAYAPDTVPFSAPAPKRNRTKPAAVKPRRVTKAKKPKNKK